MISYLFFYKARPRWWCTSRSNVPLLYVLRTVLAPTTTSGNLAACLVTASNGVHPHSSNDKAAKQR